MLPCFVKEVSQFACTLWCHEIDACFVVSIVCCHSVEYTFLINNKKGKCSSLVTKRRDYRDVEVHLEFMVAHRDYRLVKDREKMTALRQQIVGTLRKNGTLEEENRGSTLQVQMFEGFKDKEAERLRGQYILLNMFQESWIPAIRAGTYTRYQLFDLARDPEQQVDVSAEFPNVLARLKKKLFNINSSVMADAPQWQ